MSPKEPLPADDAVVRWDRPRWISVFSSHSPTIREVTESLGLGLSASSSTTNRGIPKFDNPDYRRLSSDVTRLSKELPKERDALLDFAADPHSLDAELEELLATFGPAIWGRDTDRSCLLAPDGSKKTYLRDLFYEDPDDKRILKTHLHRWIIIKACYYIRNMKLKRSSAANDYDTLVDVEADGDPQSPAKAQLSPGATSKSSTPPVDGGAATAGAEASAGPSRLKKRKSSAYMSWSDGEEMDASGTPAKRPYQSQTLPLQRKSPRKSLKSFDANSPVSENIPPVPSIDHARHTSSNLTAVPASTPEPCRPLLTPLSSNDLNSTVRNPSAAPPANGFTAVNTGSFTAVNTASPVREIAPQVPPQSGARHYSSPYESTTNGVLIVPSTSKPTKGPPLNTAAASASFQAINSPASGVSARNSPVVQHTTRPPLPSHHQPQIPAQPTSRSNTPTLHHNHRPSLAHQRSSRSNTPIAPASAAQPAPTSNAQIAPAPAVANPDLRRVNGNIAPSIPGVPSGAHHGHQPQPVLKSQIVVASPNHNNPVDLSLLQCEVLGSLMQYFFPSPNTPPDEAVLLHKMEMLWHLGAHSFRAQCGPLYDLETNVFVAWITERRKIAELRQALKYRPAVPPAEVVDRLLAMNDLRMMRLKWKNMSSAEGLSSEDLLCRAFAVLTNTRGSEYVFKDGLDRLNEGSLEFLRTEEMTIRLHRR